MVITEPILVALGLALWSVLFVVIGYAIAERESLYAIGEIKLWIKDTKSNEWVSAGMYEEMTEKYEDLLKEYEQYKGCMKALKDGGIFNDSEREK